MYCPYLRGKLYELKAVEELIEKKKITDEIVPIIEPVSETSVFDNFVTYMVKNKRKFIGILNPQVGSYKTNNINNYGKSEYFIEGRIIKSQSDIDELQKMSSESSEKFAAIFVDSRSSNLDVSKIDNNEIYKVIPDSASFRQKFNNLDECILLDDKFIKQKRNSDYLKIASEFFSKDHQLYKKAGYIGFSDYSIIGEEFSDSGFAPYAVSIHIVYFDDDNALKVRHFTSLSNSDTRDQNRKVQEALEKFTKWYNNEPQKNHSFGADYLKESYEKNQNHGLGVLKKCSIMHHLEIMNKYLTKQKNEGLYQVF